ncbi:hypothetical protein GCM10010218_28710 [Streptomyces mashuensis]|uniref:Uncharacterized protein n=1 Tax=Streptomyces mashuensis TaxID=33904 RepID=A0A919ED12_9ACTN|nr:hypothetical protein [Streptomyces mashuensis]GHF45761.1 hypothetical protein GCM10010218_28710 [Streptomyces mashuensis]
MNYGDLMQVDLGKLGTAVSDWKKVTEALEKLARQARDGLKAKADGAAWAGANATVTKGFVGKTVVEVEDLHHEAESIWRVVQDAHTELTGLQRRAKALTKDAGEDGFVVMEGQGGAIRVTEAVCTVKPTEEKNKEKMQWYAETLADLVRHAAEVDAAATRALQASHGNDPYNAGHARYTSLDEDMLPRALNLAAKGGHASKEQKGELRRLWESLSPEARAKLWEKQRKGLLEAGVLAPRIMRVRPDEGAGAYDVESPGKHDYWVLAQANAMSVGGDFKGYTDAARNMDHYLRGTGTPIELDVDRMLTDDQALRACAQGTLAENAAEWRQKGLEEFEKSGGRPVVIPVESERGKYKHRDLNWFYAVGSANANTTGVVTVVPGEDGKPKVSLDYQVNVWDRYNWDPGKSTKVGPTTMTDADMARLHTTGLAKEYDMRGSGSLQHYDLGNPGALPSPPADPGRDGTRTDIARNGDAR